MHDATQHRRPQNLHPCWLVAAVRVHVHVCTCMCTCTLYAVRVRCTCTCSCVTDRSALQMANWRDINTMWCVPFWYWKCAGNRQFIPKTLNNIYWILVVNVKSHSVVSNGICVGHENTRIALKNACKIHLNCVNISHICDRWQNYTNSMNTCSEYTIESASFSQQQCRAASAAHYYCFQRKVQHTKQKDQFIIWDSQVDILWR